MRWDDFNAVMSSGPRSGQKVMKTVNDRLIANGTRFLQARSDNGTCAPGRASLITGMYQANHGIGPGNTADDYYDYYRWGKKKPASTGVTGKVTRWIGPWEFDLAKKVGFADTPLSVSAQQTAVGTGGITNNPSWGNGATGHGNTRADRAKLGDITAPDDLQAFTGSLATWLSVNGVRCGLVGKYQNAYADTTDNRYTTAAEQYLFVPPGWSYWAALSGDDSAYNGGAQDHWRVHTCEFSGTNAGDGWGTTGTEVAYRYDLPIQSITWASNEATVTIDSTPGRPHRLVVGDEVHIEGVTPSAYNSSTGAAGFTVSAVVSDYVFKYTLTTNPGGAGSAAVGQIMTAYPRTQYGDYLWGKKAVEFINGCTDTQPWFLYMSPDNPHQGVNSSGSNDDTHERERRYKDTVTQSDYAMWGGVAGAISPATVSGSINSTRTSQWQQRQEMLASTDDAIGLALDACEARGWTNIIVVLTSDNGFQTGEQEANEGSVVWDMLGGKGYIYDGSVRLPFIVKHPKWARGVNETLPVSQADVPLSVLDWFGLTTHHAHTKRDGYSLQRLMTDMSDTVRNRAQLITRGDWWRGTAEAIVDSSLKKLVRVQAAPTTTYELWERADDTAYETVDIASTNTAKVATLQTRLDNLRDCRWDGTTNSCRTA